MRIRKTSKRTIRSVRDGMDAVADANAAVAANVGEHGASTGASTRQWVVARSSSTKGAHVTDEVNEAPELSSEELEAEGGEALPDREAMSLVNTNVAIPINAAVAANVLSDDAIAYAQAEQDAAIDQSQ
jgi:hypothetical protein